MSAYILIVSNLKENLKDLDLQASMFTFLKTETKPKIVRFY